jgi:hypothetical protein
MFAQGGYKFSPNKPYERMHKLRTILRALSRDRLIAVIAFLFVSVQTAGIVHALDLDAHDGSAPCHLCQAHDRQGSAPPPTIAQLVANDAPSVPVLQAPTPSLSDSSQHLLPPPRGPPAR